LVAENKLAGTIRNTISKRKEVFLLNKHSFFYCYNKTVSDFLSSRNIKFITVAQDLKTSKIFSLYYIDSTFQEALSEYKKLK
jgi:hypothetical protein